MFPKRSRLVLCCALFVVFALSVAACGGGGDDAAATDATTRTEPVTTTTAAPIIAPLTGLVDPTGVSMTRPAMTVKIDNTRPALPQWGVDQADVVYEEVVEGQITRLALMFQSQAPGKIGPIRSVRNTDQAIVWPVGGIFVYSGGAQISIRSISEAPVHLIDEEAAGDTMFRDRSLRAPFNLYGIGDKLFAEGGEPVPPPPIFQFRAAGASAVGEPATSFNVGFRGTNPSNAVNWTWNPASGSYTRNVFGADLMTGTGAPIAPQNVVVQFVNYVGGEGRGGAGAEGSEAEMLGTGEAWVFTGGVVIKGSWRRDSKEAPTRFVDSAGAPIALAPGQTWVELPQIGYAVTVTP
jgi:Protein of unknown function (DUF3048) N-terminal domain/Protein of unknown function (DUF3048) C-terminal domain